MPKTDNSPTLDTRICKEKMRLTVTNSYPLFQKKAEQEIETKLYRIFNKYADV